MKSTLEWMQDPVVIEIIQYWVQTYPRNEVNATIRILSAAGTNVPRHERPLVTLK